MKGMVRMKKKQKPERAYLHAFFRDNHLNFAATMALSALAGTFGAAASWLLGTVTDCMTTGDMDGLIRVTVITAIGVPVLCAIIWLGLRVKARFVRKAMTQYKALAFECLGHKGISAFNRENTGRYLSALTNDAVSIETQYLENLPTLLEQIISFVISLGIMLYCSPMLTLVLVIASAFPIVVSIAMSGKYAALEKEVSDENESYTGSIKDLLSGFAVIKSFKAEKETQKIFESASGRVEQAKERKRSYAALVSSFSNAAGLVAQMGTFLAGAFMAIRGDITPGTVMLFVNLCNSVLGPIQTVPTCWAGIQGSLELVRKLAGLTQENTGHGGEITVPRMTDAMTLDQVSFGYEEDKPVLQGVDLRFEAGKKYAVVGASGSGKSTLLNLLMGAYDSYTGSISIDGRELRDVNTDSLYELMSLIGQNVFLFDATVRENITMFRDFPDEAVEAAVKMSGLDAVIAGKGEDYRCGENGVGLSGGERQRVSIARSLLRGSQVLMLDEATAALDNQTAFEVTDAILDLEDLTRIVVTHRLEEALLKRYDEIIVLRGGQVAERGTYESLMDRKGYFYSLYCVSN